MTTAQEEAAALVGEPVKHVIVIQTRAWVGAEWNDTVVWKDDPGAVEEARKFMAIDVRGRTKKPNPYERLTRQVTTIEVIE